MGEPARRNAEGPAPRDDPDRKPDPRAAAWADVRRAAAIGMDAHRLAVEELVAAAAKLPGDPAGEALKSVRAAMEMVRLTGGVVESLTVIAGRCTASEAEFELERERGYAEGYAARDAERCRLGVIDGGRAGPR